METPETAGHRPRVPAEGKLSSAEVQKFLEEWGSSMLRIETARVSGGDYLEEANAMVQRMYTEAEPCLSFLVGGEAFAGCTGFRVGTFIVDSGTSSSTGFFYFTHPSGKESQFQFTFRYTRQVGDLKAFYQEIASSAEAPVAATRSASDVIQIGRTEEASMGSASEELIAIAAQLREARHLGRWRRWRIMVPTVGAGLSAWLCWITLQCLLLANVLGPSAVALQPFSALLRCVSPVLIMYSILPSDPWALQGVRVLFLLMLCLHVVAFGFNVQAKTDGSLDSRWGSSRSSSMSLLVSYCALTRRAVNILTFLGVFLGTFTVRAQTGKGWWQDHLLLAQWDRFKYVVFVFSICDFGMSIILFVAGNVDAALYNILISAVPELALGVFMITSTFKSRVQSWLSSSTPAFAVAGTIAAMLDGSSAEELSQRAAKLFRCVLLREVSEQEFAHQASPIQVASRIAVFGEIDAFISHSWFDDPELKWQALQEWRAEFYAQFGREPVVWIDKFCIDQSSIELNLSCLPLFLAGCKTLVVLCGESYLQRLWCILELFVFSEVGSWEAVTVKVFSQKHQNDLDALNYSIQKRVAEFDVQRASCHDPGDTQRLLSVIQGGCSSTQDFNTMVRNLLRHRLESNEEAPGLSL